MDDVEFNGWSVSGWESARIDPMPENNEDPEFKAALATVLRDLIGEDFFAAGRTEEEFKYLVEALNTNGKNAGLVPTLRRFHFEHGQYPATYSEMFPPGSPRILDRVPFNK